KRGQDKSSKVCDTDHGAQTGKILTPASEGCVRTRPRHGATFRSTPALRDRTREDSALTPRLKYGIRLAPALT
ncbi:MAG: hypothetical protein ACM35E_16400, partial [Deltaproteobacteria bacterium]